MVKADLRRRVASHERLAALHLVTYWQISLQKSFSGDERNFLELLMRFVCGDVRDLIVSHKTDHGPAHRRYRALQQWRCLKICFREIFGIVRFSTFATLSARMRSPGGALNCRLGGGALARRRFLEVQGHPDQASLDAWRRLAFPLYTRAPRDPDIAQRAVSRSEVQRWFTKPGGESHTFNMFPDLGRIRCATVVLGGEDDPIHPIESQADIAAALPQHLVQFERFPNCRHAVIPDAPERAMAMIRDFSTDRTITFSS